MLRRLSRPLGGLCRQRHITTRQRFSSAPATKVSDPLRILFCGSDAFSCESLRALHEEHVRDGRLIDALDVMVLPPKRTGRGFKQIREGECSHCHLEIWIRDKGLMLMRAAVPCKAVAEQLGLRVHQRDTFTKWEVCALNVLQFTRPSADNESRSSQREQTWSSWCPLACLCHREYCPRPSTAA